MKTRAKSVIVELFVNGRIKPCSIPIAIEDGDLMTRRLERLLKGKINYGDREKTQSIHYVGMSWHAPYLILEDINRECVRLLNQIEKMGVQLDLNDLLKPAAIPCGYHNEKITFLVQRQLTLRQKLKRKLREAQKAKKDEEAKKVE